MYVATNIMTITTEYAQSNTTNFLLILILILIVPLWMKTIFMSWRLDSLAKLAQRQADATIV